MGMGMGMGMGLGGSIESLTNIGLREKGDVLQIMGHDVSGLRFGVVFGMLSCIM